MDSSKPHFQQALSVSLTAAAQIILAQSSFKSDIVFSLDSQELSTFPDGTYNMDLSEEDEQHIDETEIDDMAIQSLLDLMNDSGVDWAGNPFGESLDFPELNMEGMLS
ncbi:hypothetical protein N7463_010680 [Penicillium fimorum]|uniref:Uncharacterized protein n=1 Tax=Penicillium fimorum TaxID=1882269 RepID=A0A9W9XKM7_9EURO|nr:hypothetical protein N7463_010680 [Penicillium fimorum]